MEISKYARIGKSPIIKAIGIQKNHKETYYTESTVIDRSLSGCYICTNYKNVEYNEFMPPEVREKAATCCANCPHAVYKTVSKEHVTYINEKNKYGYAPRLKANALKLLLVYHFLSPDNMGIIQSVSVHELAEYIGCSVRTICNANAKLQKFDYISFSHAGSDDQINVMLNGYKDYSLPANKGGRGYATFNKEIMDQVIHISSLTKLRICLRTALDGDVLRGSGEMTIEKTFQSMRNYLPDYCKPNVIRKALLDIKGPFSVDFSRNGARFHIPLEFHGRQNYENDVDRGTAFFSSYIETLKSHIRSVNEAILVSHTAPDEEDIKYLRSEGITTRVTKHKLFADIPCSASDYHDLGVLSSRYPISSIKNCISYIYSHYCIYFRKFKIGALIRSILKANKDAVWTEMPIY